MSIPAPDKDNEQEGLVICCVKEEEENKELVWSERPFVIKFLCRNFFFHFVHPLFFFEIMKLGRDIQL